MRIVLAAAAAALFVACAGLRVNEVRQEQRAAGIRYYQRAPFLLIYTDNAGGLTSDLLFLPDTRTVMSVEPYAVLASNRTSLEFSDGVLTKGEADVDTGAIPKAALAALEKAVTASLAGGFALPGEQPTLPAPVLYRIDFRNGEIVLTGTGREDVLRFGDADGAQ